jgi:hypothetical protein
MNIKYMAKKVFLLLSLNVLSKTDLDYFVESNTERTKIHTSEYSKNKFFSNLVILNGLLKTNITENDPLYSMELLRTATKGYEELLRFREQLFHHFDHEKKLMIVERFEKFVTAERELQYAIFLQFDLLTLKMQGVPNQTITRFPMQRAQ